MLILNMILRITGFTQEQLANYLNVSRASLISWLKDDSNMSINSKSIIASAFNFPVSYFDIDLNKDLDVYRVVYSTIFEFWKKQNVVVKDDKENIINNILNEIESSVSNVCHVDFSNEEIIEGLINGYNPFTGKIFDENHILKDKRVVTSLRELVNQDNKPIIKKEELSNEQLVLFERLRDWRKNKYIEEGYYSAYVVLNDKTLINICSSNIKSKDDLKSIKGIGPVRYQKYADELFDIINS